MAPILRLVHIPVYYVPTVSFKINKDSLLVYNVLLVKFLLHKVLANALLAILVYIKTPMVKLLV
jgi:hypothetical protein